MAFNSSFLIRKHDKLFSSLLTFTALVGEKKILEVLINNALEQFQNNTDINLSSMPF